MSKVLEVSFDVNIIAGILWQLSNRTAVKFDSCQKKVVSLTAVRFPVQEFWQLSGRQLSRLKAFNLTAVRLKVVTIPVLEIWKLSAWLFVSCQRTPAIIRCIFAENSSTFLQKLYAQCNLSFRWESGLEFF